MVQKILVTGAAGFIGSNFVRMLLQDERADWRVLAYDALTYAGNLANLAEFEGDENFEFVKGDICDSQAIDEVMRGVDVVVN